MNNTHRDLHIFLGVAAHAVQLLALAPMIYYAGRFILLLLGVIEGDGLEVYETLRTFVMLVFPGALIYFAFETKEK